MFLMRVLDGPIFLSTPDPKTVDLDTINTRKEYKTVDLDTISTRKKDYVRALLLARETHFPRART